MRPGPGGAASERDGAGADADAARVEGVAIPATVQDAIVLRTAPACTKTAEGKAPKTNTKREVKRRDNNARPSEVKQGKDARVCKIQICNSQNRQTRHQHLNSSYDAAMPAVVSHSHGRSNDVCFALPKGQALHNGVLIEYRSPEGT